jgi:hypothetical protein
VPAVRATPVSVPAVRGRTGPLPVVGRQSFLRVVLIALGVGVLIGGVMAGWMHLSQETAAPVVPAPAPAPVVERVAPAPPAPPPEPAEVEEEVEEVAPAEAKAAAKPVKKRRTTKKSASETLGLKNPFEKK